MTPTGKSKVCTFCGAEFTIRPHRWQQRFCSGKCQERAYNRNRPKLTYGELQKRQANFQPRAISLSEAAWLACAFDAEGTLGVFRSSSGFRVSVLLTNTNEHFLGRATEIVGADGVRVYTMAQPRNPKHKVCLRLEVLPRAIESTLEAVKPYLVCKGRQAELCLTFRKAMLALVVNRTNTELYERLYQESRALNKRGI